MSRATTEVPPHGTAVDVVPVLVTLHVWGVPLRHVPAAVAGWPPTAAR